MTNTHTYTKEEQAANRQKWTAALRSGDYPQGKHTLKTVADRYCCLGVACDLAAREGVLDAFDQPATLTKSVQDWLGLLAATGTTTDGHEYGPAHDDGDVSYAHALTELNDNADWDFNQIADLIDAGGVRCRS